MDSGEKSKQSLLAPAKVNLRLEITGRRPNGYHDLRMVMVKLDLADEIDCEILPGGEGTEIRADDPRVPCDSTNTMWKAADLVRQRSDRRFGIRIMLRKKIPTAAGLGGGSSDGAAVLLALNRGMNLNWTTEDLIDLGVKMSADIPFFLVEGPQRVEGIGEILSPLSLPSHPLILMNPGFPVSTADAYRWFETSPEGGGLLTAHEPSDNPLDLANDLEGVVIPRYPVLARMKELLREAGALGTLMSGSGPTVFGVFDSAMSQDRGYEILQNLQEKKEPGWWMRKARTLPA